LELEAESDKREKRSQNEEQCPPEVGTVERQEAKEQATPGGRVQPQMPGVYAEKRKDFREKEKKRNHKEENSRGRRQLRNELPLRARKRVSKQEKRGSNDFIQVRWGGPKRRGKGSHGPGQVHREVHWNIQL